MDYYASYKNSKDLRKELVSYALTYGNKKAARHFQTTVKTVRKWRKRWQEQKGMGLKDRSKKPQKKPSHIEGIPSATALRLTLL